jgi:hypothetical protein
LSSGFAIGLPSAGRKYRGLIVHIAAPEDGARSFGNRFVRVVEEDAAA